MDEMRKIYKGPQRRQNRYSVLGNIDCRIDLMENQIGDVEDNLKRFP